MFIVLLLAIFISAPAEAHTVRENELARFDKSVRMAQAPASWCDDFTGNPAGQDNTIDTIIVNPAGSSNRDQEIASLSAGAIHLFSEHLSQSSGQTRSLSVARGNKCSGDDTTIKSVTISETANQLRDLNNSSAVDAIARSVDQAYPASDNIRLLLVTDYQPSGIAGYGLIAQNKAIVFVKPGQQSLRLASVIGHEVFHILGAVNKAAPHASLNWHCFDGFDMMCYDDGTLPQPMIEACPAPTNQIEPIDCGNDDYFAPNPAPGSFLANNPSLNVYNSPYLGHCVGSEQCVIGSKIIISGEKSEIINSNNARLQVFIEGMRGGEEVAFQWGSGERLDHEARVAIDKSGDQQINQILDDLDPETSYRWRVIVRSNFGGAEGATQSLSTPAEWLRLSNLKKGKQRRRWLYFSFEADDQALVRATIAGRSKTIMTTLGYNQSKIRLPKKKGSWRLRLTSASNLRLARELSLRVRKSK